MASSTDHARMGAARDRLGSRTLSVGCTVGLLAVLCFLAGFSIVSQRDIAAHSRAADRGSMLAAAYADARFWVGQEESLERKYRLEPSAGVRAAHTRAEEAVEGDLARVRALDPSSTRFVVAVERTHAAYTRAVRRLFAAVDAHDAALVIRLDHALVDPVFAGVERSVYASSARSSASALRASGALRDEEGAATGTIGLAFGIGLALIIAFGGILIGLRRRLGRAHEREVAALLAIARSDALTGLGNHRAFHEDLAQSLHRIGGATASTTLILVDLDGLKVVNDTLGHQVGDDHIRTVADALRATVREADGVYRIGGDEFAVILEGERAMDALDVVGRVNVALSSGVSPVRVSVSAGIADATDYRHKDALIRDADIALLAAKRSERAVVVYTQDIERQAQGGRSRAHTGTLANALALAVDAKDSYTRSHCQTVAQLCALIAEELGFDAERIARLRLAGLLHDVGKIGVPDAILNKPTRLDEAEYEIMRRHATLGGDIAAAADLAEESDWIRHHHERFDGTGYPDRLSCHAIPLESRIILACDAYEAMTSNRPYRRAPGHRFAIAELERHAGTQFDPDVVIALRDALERRSTHPALGQRALAEVA
jgi:diguanylate cyclase (GGDEF)-like protein/putative nucleotidyltransferase with HDIG domain